MKIKIKKRFLVFGIIALIIGMYALLAARAGLFADFGLSKNTSMFLKVLGGVIFLLGNGLIACSILSAYKLNKNLEIEEKDERNIALRGKAAQTLRLVSTGVYLVLLIIFLVLDYDIPALLLSVGALIENFAFIIAVAYYGSKY
jgi:uncharacterized RDD family membrane protein YckC